MENKKKYNKLLQRYYNGCKYLEENPNDFSKYINNLLDIKEKLEKTLIEIQRQCGIVTDIEILEGFKI